MGTIANVVQLREFLQTYNTLTHRCFSACVRQFNTPILDDTEARCTQQCTQTFAFCCFLIKRI